MTAPVSPPPSGKTGVRWGIVAAVLGGCGCLSLGVIGLLALVALPDFLASRRHAREAAAAPTPPPAGESSGPLLGPVGDDQGSRDCGCSYSDEKGNELLWSSAEEDGVIHLHLKGHDVSLRAEGEPGSHDRRFTAGGTFVHLVEESKGSACPDAGEQCESEKMQATLHVEDGPQKVTVGLTGECGC